MDEQDANNFGVLTSVLHLIMLGHKATTCCMVIANRLIKEANTGYKSTIDNLIKEVLERI